MKNKQNTDTESDSEPTSGRVQRLVSLNLLEQLAKEAGIVVFEQTEQDNEDGWDGSHGYYMTDNVDCKSMGCESYQDAVEHALTEIMGRKLSGMFIDLFLSANVKHEARLTGSEPLMQDRG